MDLRVNIYAKTPALSVPALGDPGVPLRPTTNGIPPHSRPVNVKNV